MPQQPRIIGLQRPSSARIGQLLEVWESGVRSTHTFLSEDDITAIRQDVRKHFFQMDMIAFIADENGRMQGFIGIHDAVIEMLFIRKEAQGRGYGRALVEYARKRRSALFVDVNEQNEAALAFYKHLGFHVTARSAVDGQGRPFPILHMRHGPPLNA